MLCIEVHTTHVGFAKRLFVWLCRYWPEKKLRICVTGAGGFIASHLAKRLKSEGHYLVCSDWKRNSFMPVRARSPGVEAGHRCTQLVWPFGVARRKTSCVYATSCLCLASSWDFGQSPPTSLGLLRTVRFRSGLISGDAQAPCMAQGRLVLVRRRRRSAMSSTWWTSESTTTARRLSRAASTSSTSPLTWAVRAEPCMLSPEPARL